MLHQTYILQGRFFDLDSLDVFSCKGHMLSTSCNMCNRCNRQSYFRLKLWFNLARLQKRQTCWWKIAIFLHNVHCTHTVVTVCRCMSLYCSHAFSWKPPTLAPRQLGTQAVAEQCKTKLAEKDEEALEIPGSSWNDGSPDAMKPYETSVNRV